MQLVWRFPQKSLLLRGFVGSFEIFVSIVKCIIEAAARLLSGTDAWFGGLLDCLDDQYHVVLSCVRAPWTWGFFVCFAPCFAYPM